MKEKINQKNTKGQSAIEYLTTYGWMLLVIAIVGGAIFTTVQNSSQIQSVSGLTNANVQVSDYGLNDNGLQLSLRAAASDQVEIQKIEIKDSETGITADISPDKVVAVGDTAQVNLEDAQSTETSDTFDMEITYDTGSLEGLTAEGQITGGFGVFNRISLEEAKFNRSTNELQIQVRNTGDNSTDSISYTVEANNSDYTGSLSNLPPDNTSTINITTDQTYPLESISLETEGPQFVNSESELKCTPTQGLVGYWPFNDEQTKNGYVEDLSGYGNNGSLKNNVLTGKESPVGESYGFKQSGGAVKIDDSPNLAFTGEISVLSWYKTSNTDDYLEIIGKGVYPARWNMHIKSNDDGDNTFRIDDSDGDSAYSREGNGTYVDGDWHLSVGKFDGQDAMINVDGEHLRSRSESGEVNEFDNSEKIQIGSNNFDGLLDEVRIYNRSLPQPEIQRLYNVRSKDWAVSGCKLTG